MNNKAKLEVVELILKTLEIDYEIIPSKTHPSKLKRLIYEQPLDQVQETLTTLDIESKIYAEQIKKDLEARLYWLKLFQKFQNFK